MATNTPDYKNLEDEWWYNGIECEAHRDGIHNDGRTCSGIDWFGGTCAPCTKELKVWLKAHRGFADQVIEINDQLIIENQK